MGKICRDEESVVWPIHWRDGLDFPGLHLTGLRTPVPSLTKAGLPVEIGLILPNRNSFEASLNIFSQDWGEAGPNGVGLFLADPFIQDTVLGGLVQRSGFNWVSNFPTVDIQGPDFVQQISDVGLNHALELDRLSLLQEAGLNLAICVSNTESACNAVALAPEVLIIVPRVADFAAGFPSLRKRGTVALEVSQSVQGLGWTGPVLILAEAGEAAHQTLWPDCVAGVLCRPGPDHRER